MSLIDSLTFQGWLKTPRIIEAFQKIKRVDFLSASSADKPEDLKNLAEMDEAFPIGYKQTISQPLVVAFMLELLDPQPGDKILDIGPGSGWTTALLAEIIGRNGRIIAIEIIPELKEFGEKNVAKYNFIEKGIVEFVCADGSKGCPELVSRPELAEGFDRILASASVQTDLPKAWKEQLKIGGRIVTPIDSSIWLFVKKAENKFEEKEYPGFLFVPLIEK